MKQFSPKISKALLDRLVLYLNDRPYKEVAELLANIFSEVQGQLPVAKAVKETRRQEAVRAAKPNGSSHYAKGP
jgi:hypothetical protein